MKTVPIHLIRNQAVTEKIDYILLSSCLKEYAAPRDVITRLLQRHDLIRVKKGLCVFGEVYQKRLISLEVLANQVYGPSYVSCEYVRLQLLKSCWQIIFLSEKNCIKCR